MNCVIDNPCCNGTCANCVLVQVRQERDEAREAAFEFYLDLPYMGDYLFQKHHRGDLDEYPWLARMLEERAITTEKR
jgi:hypothetical protein